MGGGSTSALRFYSSSKTVRSFEVVGHKRWVHIMSQWKFTNDSRWRGFFSLQKSRSALKPCIATVHVCDGSVADVACMVTCRLYCALFEQVILHYCCCFAVHLVNLNLDFQSRPHPLRTHLQSTLWPRFANCSGVTTGMWNKYHLQWSEMVLNLPLLHYCYVQARKQPGSQTREHRKLKTKNYKVIFGDRSLTTKCH